MGSDLARQLGVTVSAVRTRRAKLRKALGPDAPPGRIEDRRVSRVSLVKTCPICGSEFKARPADRITCGEECARRHRVLARQGKRAVWSDKAKRRRSELGQTANLTLGPLGTSLSPLTGAFETNIRAKEWWIVNLESGQHWPAVCNLGKWCRDHADLFAPDDWQHAYAGLRNVQNWLTGKSKVKRSCWKSWSLYREAKTPDK